MSPQPLRGNDQRPISNLPAGRQVTNEGIIILSIKKMVFKLAQYLIRRH
jgi:hypothetical protein